MVPSANVQGGVTDADLIAAARTGDSASYGVLYERHAGAAWAVARQYTDSPADADDVVADSFTAVYSALQRGNGPAEAFRAYLFTVVRRTAAARREHARRVEPTDDLATLEAGTALAGTAEEPALAGFERGVVARAFHSLPERWQAVLWHTEVEELSPAQIAPLLGLTANGVAALAYRAREGLRQAYLQQHLQDPMDDGCRAVSGKLGAYVRGGLGTRDTAQVEAHLDDCGDCRALVLELSDVNHGMRSVIAPLVLGTAGVGALAHLLPVGGGIAAGVAAVGAAHGAGSSAGATGAATGTAGAGAAAAAGGAGAGGGTAAAGGALGGAAGGALGGAAGAGSTFVGTGAVAAGAVATGATAVIGGSGVGAAGAGAAAGGLAAFFGSIPIGAAAVAAGAVAVAAITTVGILGAVSGDDLVAGTGPTTSATATAGPSGSASQSPSQAGVGAPPVSPSALPSLPADDEPAGDGPADGAPGAGVPSGVPTAPADGPAQDQPPAVPPASGPTAPAAPTTAPPTPPPPTTPPPTVPGPTTEPTPTPTPTSVPTTPVVPPPAPARVTVELPEGGLVLAAGLSAQELAFGVRNSGGTSATDLVADVTMPPGVTVDPVTVSVEALTGGSALGRFAPVTATGWVCVDVQPGLARCALPTLPPQTVVRLVLQVTIDEGFDAADTQLGLHVSGGGLDFVAPPIPLTVSPAPARLALGQVPTPPMLVTGRPRVLDLALENAGGSALGAAPATVRVQVPPGIAWSVAAGSAPWACAEGGAAPTIPRVSPTSVAVESTTVVCTLDTLAARAKAPLSLALAAGDPGAVTGRQVTVALAPAGLKPPVSVVVPFTVVRPAHLAVSGAGAVRVGLGVPGGVGLTVSNSGDLPASDVRVALVRPASTAWDGAPSGPGWSCAGPSGPRVVCTLPTLDPGASADLSVALRGVAGAFDDVGALVATVTGTDADTDAPHAVQVTATRPVLHVPDDGVDVLLGDADTGTVSFGVQVDPGADANGVVATVTLPLQLTATQGGGPQSACVAVTSRTIRCDLGDLPAGGSAQALVNVRAAGSARGTVTVGAQAAGSTTATGSTQVDTASAGLSPRARFDGGWAVTEVGAPLLTCRSTDTACRSALDKGDSDNNAFEMVPLDEARPKGEKPAVSVPVASTSRLTVPAGRTIAFAGLYWSANLGPGDQWSGPQDSARLRGPSGAYVDVPGQVVVKTSDNAARQYYQSFADVTAQVSAQGSGQWSVADVAVSATRKDTDRTYYAGWALVVVYADPGSDATVTVYDGAAWVGTSALPPVFRFAAPAGTVARIGVVAWEGDRTLTGDRFLLDGSAALTPQRWGGAGPVAGGSSNNALDSTATGWRAANSLGTDAKGFGDVPLARDVSTLTATTSGDQYLVGAITLRTSPVR